VFVQSKYQEKEVSSVKILNLYAGIGGNRKLWGDEHEVTAVESEQYIADAYEKLFPGDNVVVGDAHQYLLNHYEKFDFIWSSPPCPTHSKMSPVNVALGRKKYPDMSMYQEIIWLQNFFAGNWVVENVIPYYEPLIKPMTILDRHCFWSNRHIGRRVFDRNYGEGAVYGHNTGGVTNQSKEVLAEAYGIDLPEGTKNQRKLLRNAVMPPLGLHVFNAVGFQRHEIATGENLSFLES
jgi:DNA (cytosine-5)-methyltransferase 1